MVEHNAHLRNSYLLKLSSFLFEPIIHSQPSPALIQHILHADHSILRSNRRVRLAGDLSLHIRPLHRGGFIFDDLGCVRIYSIARHTYT